MYASYTLFVIKACNWPGPRASENLQLATDTALYTVGLFYYTIIIIAILVSMVAFLKPAPPPPPPPPQ